MADDGYAAVMARVQHTQSPNLLVPRSYRRPSGDDASSRRGKEDEAASTATGESAAARAEALRARLRERRAAQDPSRPLEGTAAMTAELRKGVEELKRRQAGIDEDAVPEVHLIGEISSGDGFPPGVTCVFEILLGDRWNLLQGTTRGQTHVDYPAPDSTSAVWAHPIDVHLSAGMMVVCGPSAFSGWTHDVHTGMAQNSGASLANG